MNADQIKCRVELEGWRLHFVWLTPKIGREMGSVMDLACSGALAKLQKRYPDRDLSSDPEVCRFREGIADLGIDPAKTAPSSERVLTRMLESGTFPRGPIAWEYLHLLVTHSPSPWSLMDAARLEGPFEFRYGKSGETIGCETEFSGVEGLPVLTDQKGVVASPWTCSRKEDFGADIDPLFVCFMPEKLWRKINPKAHIGRLVWMTWAYTFVVERAFSQNG